MRTIFSKALAAAALATLIQPAPASAQSREPTGTRPIVEAMEALAASAPALAPAPPVQKGTSARRAAWTGIGAGIGFGAGVLAGMTLFEDSVHAERKIWLTSAAGAALGATVGALSSRERKPEADGERRPRRWAGMIAGAAAGAAIGMIVLPATQCDTRVNPECPVVMGLVVGVPMAAAGAAIGALIDRLR